MAVVGPGSQIQEETAPRPLLEGASEYEYVTILNPMSDDFMVMVAQDIPVNLPFEIRKDESGRTAPVTNTEQDARQVYGLNLKNPDFQAKKHIHNTSIIPAGGTMNFRGNEAQVVVRQLVNEIIQREGNKRMLADPVTRLEVEKRIVQRRGSVQDLMDGRMQTPQQQADTAINQSNEVNHEPFPGLKQPTGQTEAGSLDLGADSPAPPKRGPGRPPKTPTA